MIWAFRDEDVDRLVGSAAGLHRMEYEADGGRWFGTSADGVAAVERIAQLGCRIDSTGLSRAGGGQAPADAERIYDAVQALDLRRRMLVRGHGRAGTEPPWQLGRTTPVKPKREGGTGRILVLDDRRRGVWPHCPVIWLDLEVELATLRADYRAWHAGLAQVHAWLSEAPLETIEVLPPLAPAMPWAHEREVLAPRPGRPQALTPEQVEELRAAWVQGQGSQAELAQRFGVSRATVARHVGDLRCVKTVDSISQRSVCA